MKKLEVIFDGKTDVGQVRQNNEDTFIAQQLWDGGHILLAVIDGMGGEEGGEIAADIARQSIIDYLSQHYDGTVFDIVSKAMIYANNQIVKAKDNMPELRNMGCVATFAVIDNDEETFTVAHVGDTRLYRFSGGILTKLTHDHSLVGYQEEQGIISERQAMTHPRRSIIERCLGEEIHDENDINFVETAVFPLVKNEIFLLCSDGLCDMLTSSEIASILSEKEDVESMCDRLIHETNFAGGKDNVTVVLAQVKQKETTEDEKEHLEVERIVTHNENIINQEKPVDINKPKTKVLTSLIILVFFIIVAVCVLLFETERKPRVSKQNPDKTIEVVKSESKI